MSISATTQGLRPGVCTSTSRPSVPFDGMMVYETDTNRVAVYDTNTWVYKTPASTTGSVLQVVSTTKTDTFTSGSTAAGGAVDITGLSATITPTSTSSKILVTFSVYGAMQLNNYQYFLFAARCLRGSTAIAVGDTAGSRTSVAGQNGLGGYYNGLGSITMTTLDSPATTSATTYKIQAVHANYDATSGVIYVNRGFDDADAARVPRAASSITVMEIAG